jgi:hypothetical protein
MSLSFVNNREPRALFTRWGNHTRLPLLHAQPSLKPLRNASLPLVVRRNYDAIARVATSRMRRDIWLVETGVSPPEAMSTVRSPSSST